MSKTIYHQLIIQAEPKVVFDAISTQKGLSSWWIKECEAKAEEGHINVFHFEGYPSTEFKVIKINPNKSIVWKCIGGDKQWIGTQLSFKIKSHENGSLLQFKHSKWKKQSDFFATCNFHWARHFIMLQHYCESGNSMLNLTVEKAEIQKTKDSKS